MKVALIPDLTFQLHISHSNPPTTKKKCIFTFLENSLCCKFSSHILSQGPIKAIAFFKQIFSSLPSASTLIHLSIDILASLLADTENANLVPQQIACNHFPP